MALLEAAIVAFVAAFCTYLSYKFCKIFWEEGRPLEYKKDIKLTGKTVLITGANCGLGKATALDLASRGARVILACRNKEKAEAAAEEIKKETGNQDVSIVMLDLSDLDSVNAAAEYINKTYNRLDVLINNAAVGLTDPIPTKQGFEMTFGTNHLGPFLFTHHLIDLLKKAAPSRIINVSSKALFAVWGKLNYDPGSENEGVRYPNLKGYPISKLANFYHVRVLADSLRKAGITANAVHPGCVQTEIMKRNLKGKTKTFLNKLFLLISKVAGRSVKDGCQTIVHAAADPGLEEVTGEFFMNMIPSVDQLPELAKDYEEAQKLARFSCEVCKVKYLSPEDLVITKDTINFKTDDNKKEDDNRLEDEQEQKEAENQLKSVPAVFAANLIQEMTEISESASAEKLEDTNITATLSNKSREISPVKEDVTTSPTTTEAEDISTSIVDDEI